MLTLFEILTTSKKHLLDNPSMMGQYSNKIYKCFDDQWGICFDNTAINFSLMNTARIFHFHS